MPKPTCCGVGFIRTPFQDIACGRCGRTLLPSEEYDLQQAIRQEENEERRKSAMKDEGLKKDLLKVKTGELYRRKESDFKVEVKTVGAMTITGGAPFVAISFVYIDTPLYDADFVQVLQLSEFLSNYEQIPFTKESETIFDSVEKADLRKDFNNACYIYCKSMVTKEQNIEQLLKRDTSGKPVPMNATTLEKTGMRSVYRDSAKIVYHYLDEAQQKEINDIYPDWMN